MISYHRSRLLTNLVVRESNVVGRRGYPV